ncbi:MAG: TIGR03943 family putative permease subunit [Chthoniobacterales bacterium]
MSRRLLTLLTLLLWGLLLSKFWLSGRIASYLPPHFHPMVAMAGALLILLAGLWWWASGRTDGSSHDCGCHHDHEHGAQPRSALSAGTILAFVVLLVPVTAATIVSPSQFGEAAVMNRGIVTDISQLPTFAPPNSGLEDAPPLGTDEEIPDVADWPEDKEEGVEYFTRSPDGSIQLETIDLLFAASEPALREEFANQRVTLIGQYVPPRSGDGNFDLVRMIMVCCAADGRPLGVKVSAPPPAGVDSMGWVRVTGIARFEEKDGIFEPRIEDGVVEKVEAPRATILY